MLFLHGSYDPHPVGRRLTPQPDRAAAWEELEFVRVLAEMTDLIAVRTFAGLRDFADDFAEPVLREFARESKVPVVPEVRSEMVSVHVPAEFSPQLRTVENVQPR